MTQMYSNARLSKPYSPLKAPRSTVDEFEVGIHRPSYTTFSENTLVPRHRKKTKQLFDASMKATLVYPKPEIYQLDPSIVKFSTLQRASTATSTAASTTETPAVPYTPKEHSPPQLRQAGTVVELSKHRPFAQHVGATHHRYPIDVVGDTLLRQQALMTINNLPSIIARLKDDRGELTQARNDMAPPRKKGTPPSVPPSVPPRVGSAAAAAAGDALDDFDDALDDFDEEEQLDEETEKEIKDIERIGKEIERVLLLIGTSQEPLADKDLLALKRLGVVDQGTMAATQGEAKRFATEATTAIKVRVAGLKGTPPKSGSLGQKKK